ncbi:hypothetical protein LTS08_000976 [Lithohypha guttulata]|uniref:Uncharacterized protein n=1 Tax=Lithohypha guttulata TaxID=1690604 RepID=A0AAN7YID5_9EURO|nr:hypothetical protein LTR51_006413 [Lithohypha guttulata]KAK5088621.1 hypothetical protein LTR05_002841 [Lithohypha guttulata]KAK5106853.1 hypothetical protein LTS08_000976 [Lithohypha guttulata]
MFDTHKPHPLLAQVPLTISPFVQIPVAVTLPYTFRTVPTSLPPSVLADDSNGDKPKYVKSSSGHAAHPEDIINSCKALSDHIAKSAADAQKSIQDWERQIRERDLAEKRRVAPGWLDREEKLLQPTTSAKNQDLLSEESTSNIAAPAMSPSREGEELDRAFGQLSTK